MIITPLLQQSCWEVLLSTGRKLNELDTVTGSEANVNGKRPADWTLDLISTGDILRVREVHLYCPGIRRSHAWLKITEPGTAFQFKTASMMSFGASGRQMEAQVIGRIESKETGDCTCYVWDRMLGLFEYKSNINHFGTWHPRVAKIGALSQNVIGLRLQ